MQRYFSYLFFFIVTPLLFLVGLIFFLNRPTSQAHTKDKLYIVCTTSIIADVVKNIGGENIIVESLMGPGVDPHLYKAREGDVHRLAQADIIFFNGLHLEGKMAELFQAMQKTKETLAVAQVIHQDQLIEGDFKGTFDPHVWHDVALWRLTIDAIKNILIKKDSKNTESYEAHAKNYLQQLDALALYIKERIAAVPLGQRILITAHDAFHYFGKAHDFSVLGLQGISTDAEISTHDIQQLAQYIVDHKVPAIFLESSIPERNIKAVQKAVEAKGWHIAIGPELFSDALGDQSSSADTYIKMIKCNIDSIVSALQKK